MGIRQYNPVTAGRRGASVSDFAELTKGAKPEKSLLRPLLKKGGRNNQGRITVRHRGGGHRRRYRIIDFKRDKHGIPAECMDERGQKNTGLARDWNWLWPARAAFSGDKLRPAVLRNLQLRYCP